MQQLKKRVKSKVISLLFGLGAGFATPVSYADQDLMSVFPLENYNQTVSTWIKPSDADFDKALLNADMQQKRFAIFLDHYIGALSPWNADYINTILHQAVPNDLETVENSIVANFDNTGKSSDKKSGRIDR